MASERLHTALDAYHPAVQFAYFAAVLVLGMAAFHPVLVAIVLASGFAYSVYLRGWHAAALGLRWQLPLVLVVAAVNPLFSAMGSTELFRIGLRAVYLESLAYGLCMGMLLVSVVLWFSNASHVLTSDKVMGLFGNVAPVIALMLSMAARLVPRFVRRGNLISSVQDACAPVRPRTAREKTAAHVRLASVLMGWSMEDSLETADAMRSRGWGSSRRRTVYRRVRFRARDGVAAGALGALVAAAAFLAWVACSQFAFYPRLSTLVAWWGYAVYAILMFLPLLLQAAEEVRWRRR